MLVGIFVLPKMGDFEHDEENKADWS